VTTGASLHSHTALAVFAASFLCAAAIEAQAQPDFDAVIANTGQGFVELEWDGVEQVPGTRVGWVVERRRLSGDWSIVTGMITPSSTDPGPYQWLALGLRQRIYEYRVLEFREVDDVVLPAWESNVVTADSPAMAPAFAQTAGLVVVEAESWHSRTSGSNGKDWTIDRAAPAGAVADVLIATPADGTGTCPSSPSAHECPRLDYRIEFAASGVHYVWIREFAASIADQGVLVGLDGVAGERVRPASVFGAWSWASGNGAPIAIFVPDAGEHVLNVWMSEDGARLDRVLLTTDPDFSPHALGGGPGPAESARHERAFVTVADRSDCSEPVVVACPTGYEIVGGGIHFAGKHEKCKADGATAHDKFFGFSSYPKGDGWYCRAESRLAECYAVCAHRDTVGIHSTQRHRTEMVKRVASVDALCPAGTTRIAGGYKSESFWDTPRKKEEFKVLGSYPIPQGWRCDDKSSDHYGWCYALCVDDIQLGAREIVVEGGSETFEAGCQDGYQAVAAGFSRCPGLGCGDAIDEVEARPMLEAGVAGCRVGFKDGNHPIEAPICEAVCVEDDAIFVPEPAGAARALTILFGAGLLGRSRRARRAGARARNEAYSAGRALDADHTSSGPALGMPSATRHARTRGGTRCP
jgi:hypothetical protein